MICIDSHPRANPSLDRALGIGATCAVVAVLAYMDENVAFSFISIAGMDSWYGFALGALFGAFSVLFASFLVDARRIGRRPPVIADSVDEDGALVSNSFALVPQADLGIGVGIGVKLLYQYRIFGVRNPVMRALQRFACNMLAKNRQPCEPEAIVAFANAKGIALDGWDRDIEDYPSVDAFFTRKYESLRVVEDDRLLLAPSEGTVVAYSSVALMQTLWIKQKAFTLANTGIPEQYVKSLEGGSVFSFKLDVDNLHRFYAPVSGTVVERIDHLEPLRLSHSVRPFALQAGLPIMTENRRVILVIDSPAFASRGPVIMMIVGGIGIDSIEMTVEEGETVFQGQEIGMFHMGGSAVLLAVPPETVRIREGIAVASMCKMEFATRVGDVVAAVVSS